MDYKLFVKETILCLSDEGFQSVKKMLVGEYLSFLAIENDQINKANLAEKICDYFEKIEIKSGKKFNKLVETFICNIDEITNRRIEKNNKSNKKSENVKYFRAQKYYEKAISIKNLRSISTLQLVDFARIMFCLYNSIIENYYKPIKDFNFSIYGLSINRIIESMKTEPDKGTIKIKRKKFNIKDLYCSDTFTFIMAIILLNVIIDRRIEGEYYHG